MPYKDLEQRRECARRFYRRHRTRMLAWSREYSKSGLCGKCGGSCSRSSSICKSCYSLIRKVDEESKKLRLSKYHKDYAQRNRQHLKEYRRQWYLVNRERRLAEERERRRRYPEKLRAYDRQRSLDPDRKEAKRRSIKERAGNCGICGTKCRDIKSVICKRCSNETSGLRRNITLNMTRSAIRESLPILQDKQLIRSYQWQKQARTKLKQAKSQLRSKMEPLARAL